MRILCLKVGRFGIREKEFATLWTTTPEPQLSMTPALESPPCKQTIITCIVFLLGKMLLLLTFDLWNLFVHLAPKALRLLMSAASDGSLLIFATCARWEFSFYSSALSHDLILSFCLIGISCVFQSNALPSHVKITVSRQTLFEDSFQQVRSSFNCPVKVLNSCCCT